VAGLQAGHRRLLVPALAVGGWQQHEHSRLPCTLLRIQIPFFSHLQAEPFTLPHATATLARCKECRPISTQRRTRAWAGASRRSCEVCDKRERA
jgi:hypothetical protein